MLARLKFVYNLDCRIQDPGIELKASARCPRDLTIAARSCGMDSEATATLSLTRYRCQAEGPQQ
jgi:hypothetical protein